MKRQFPFIIALFLILSCDKDDEIIPPDPPEPPIDLNANAGPAQGAEPFDVVTLDGSSSKGPQGFTYLWNYSGDVAESEINFQNKTSAKPTFTPPANGTYTFALTVAHDGKSDQDQTTVSVSGAIKIGGTLTENLILKNIQPNSSLPDYIVTNDLVVPNGLSLSIVEDDVLIAFETETGIHIQTGGTLTNSNNTQVHGFETEFIGEDGWKGIWVDNGIISLNHSIIVNAGASKFDGLEEAAAVTLSGSNTELQSFSDNEFVNSNSYDIHVPEKFPEVQSSVMRNQLSSDVPIKAVITFMGFLHTSHPNIMPDSYDYVHYIPSGANQKDATNNLSGFGFFPSGAKFYIDGDFWAGSQILVGEGCSIYMEENTGILVDDAIYARGTESENITFSGLDGKTWKGIGSRQIGMKTFMFCKILNAGHGLFDIGGFKAEEEAAYYSAYTTGTRFENCEFIGSNGFGYYNEHVINLVDERCSSTLFKDCKKGGIRINLASANFIIQKNHGNIFDLDEEIPAVLLAENEDPSRSPEGELYELGDNNFYLIDSDWIVAERFIINEGCILKFEPGHSIIYSTIYDNTFQIKGTAEKPVIFDGKDGTPGSWGGFLLAGAFNINHLIIRNGGEFLLHNASEKANIVYHYIGNNVENMIFENSTVSNSAGWGIVIQFDSQPFEFDDPNKNNTFTNNLSGDIIDLNP